MAYAVSDLPDFKKLDQNALIYKVVLGGKSIGMMTKQTGIKKDALLNYLATSPAFQDGSSCGFNASGDATFTQRTISTGRIKVNMSFCPQTLVGKYTEYQVRIAANPEGAMPFEDEIMESVTAAISAKLEKAVWQGDTTSSDTDLKWFDGLLKLMNNDSSVVDVSIDAGTSAYDAIKAVYMAIPEDVLDRAQIFVAPAIYRQYLQELVEKNYFHFTAEGAPDSIIFPGADTKVVKIDGLTGSGKIVAADPAELYYGCDLENASEEAKVWYSDDDDVFKVKFLWNSGVQYAFGDRIVLGAYTTIVSPDANAESLKSIATSASTIATKVTSSDTSLATIATKTTALADTDHIYKTQAVTGA